ncbi:MAG: ribbon-helix-helix domain-containing protein [Patescibacteria group bacterium]
MRNIITISVPLSVKRSVDSIMKENKYASVSELFRDAVRSLEDTTLIKSMMESEMEFAAGKGKKLRSLKDLM